MSVRREAAKPSRLTDRPADTSSHEPSYKAAAIAALLVFVLYFITLSPSTGMWDTGEYMAAAKVLGLPHPPGNPFFMLIAQRVRSSCRCPGVTRSTSTRWPRLASAASSGILVSRHRANSLRLAAARAGRD